jgi:hypothetical protein
MRKEMVDFQDKVLQYVRDKGYITEKQYKAIKELLINNMNGIVIGDNFKNNG